MAPVLCTCLAIYVTIVMHVFLSNHIKAHQTSINTLFTLCETKIWYHFPAIINPKGSSRISHTARFKLTFVTDALEKGNPSWQEERSKVGITARKIEKSSLWPESGTVLLSQISRIGERTEGMDWRNGLMKRERLVLEFSPQLFVWKQNRWPKLQYTGVIASWTDMTWRFAGRTTISQKLPENFEDKLPKFQGFIIAKRKKQEYDLSLIWNADQTLLNFDMPANSTVDAKETKSWQLVIKKIVSLWC